MSRFVKDFIKEPVALNDIGLVAYQNDQPILDLVGLGNPGIKSGSQVNDEFLRNLIKIKDIKLVMIYHEFFQL